MGIVRELYWPEVGVAIQRSTPAPASGRDPRVEWLEVSNGSRSLSNGNNTEHEDDDEDDDDSGLNCVAAAAFSQAYAGNARGLAKTATEAQYEERISELSLELGHRD